MRCRACDSVMEPEEIWWHVDREQWEDLCLHCRIIVMDSLHDNEVVTDTLTSESESL